MNKSIQSKAYFGGGCFWCTEAVFQRLRGVSSVKSGYAGGSMPDPNYAKVSDGDTGHAEVIEIGFDPEEISYEQLLDVFFHTHNPTTLNRQGADEGTQYRSIILYTDQEQKAAAEAIKNALNLSNSFEGPIVTEIAALEKFYPAESYHQNYYNQNRGVGYCELVITPKLDAFQRRYQTLLKE